MTNSDAKQNHAKRLCVLVLGMHRSGTSALTRALSFLGVCLPRTLLGPNPANESGHWESSLLLDYNDRLLARLGSRWDDWRQVSCGDLSKIEQDELKFELKSLIAQEYGDAPIFVLKDPRVCRLADFYVETLGELGIEVRYVVAQRNPADVIASLAARDGMTFHFAGLVWLRHVLDAERFSRAGKRAFASYEALLDDWRTTLESVVLDLGLDGTLAGDEASELAGFLKPDLRHHRTKVITDDESSLTSRWIARAYRSLTDLERDARSAEAMQALDRIASEFDPTAAAFGAAAFPELQKRDQANATERREKDVYFAGVFETLKGEMRDQAAFVQTAQTQLSEQKAQFTASATKLWEQSEAAEVEARIRFEAAEVEARRRIEAAEGETRTQIEIAVAEAREQIEAAEIEARKQIETAKAVVKAALESEAALRGTMQMLAAQLEAAQKEAGARVLDAREQLQVATGQLDELRALTARQQSDLRTLRDQLDGLQALRWNAELRLVDVQRTLSWRVTAPLRAVRRQLPRHRN